MLEPWTGARRRTCAAPFLAALLLVASAACGGSANGAGGIGQAEAAERRPVSHHLVIRGFQYEPPTLRVAVGDTLVWRNEDVVPHTATAAAGEWDSGNLGSGASWRWVASEPGTHAYLCTFHPGMKGTVEVQ